MMTLYAITMPKLGVMTEGVVVEWMVAEGGSVTAGSPLFGVETDKTTTEMEAPVDGILVRIVAPLDEPLPVGALLGVIASGSATTEAVEQFIAAHRG